MEEKIAKVFLFEDENFDNSYIFSPAIIKRKTVNGKMYRVRRYFNGSVDFESSMKRYATNNYYKKEL